MITIPFAKLTPQDTLPELRPNSKEISWPPVTITGRQKNALKQAYTSQNVTEPDFTVKNYSDGPLLIIKRPVAF